MALEIATDEAVVGDLAGEGGGTGGVDDRGPVFLDEAEDAENATDPRLAVAAVDRGAERADVRAGPRGLSQQGHRGQRGPRRPIGGVNRVAPAHGLAAVLAQELACGRIQQADVAGVPLDRDLGAEPTGGRAVVRVVDLDTAVEMDGAGAELVVAKRLDGQRPERGPLLGEHRGDLTLGRAVDAGVGPASIPAIEVRLGGVETLEAQPLERSLSMADGRLHLALAVGIADATGQRDDAVVRQHVAVERIERGVVDVRREHALAKIVEDDDLHGAAEAAETLLVQLAPAARARGEGQQADALAAVAEREEEEARAAVLARARVAHHRRSEEHTSELQSLAYLVCRLLLEKKKTTAFWRVFEHYMRTYSRC